jgi:hypothetical protein
LSCLVLSCLVLSCLVSSCLLLFCPFLYRRILLRPISHNPHLPFTCASVCVDCALLVLTYRIQYCLVLWCLRFERWAWLGDCPPRLFRWTSYRLDYSWCVLSCLVVSGRIWYCLGLWYLMWVCYIISSFLVLSCLVWSCLVLSCLVLSCLVLSCLVLYCLNPSYLVWPTALWNR